MISIISSLYKSERHLPHFIKRVKRMSTYLEKKNIIHEFIILPNSPSEREKELLKEIESSEHVRILTRDRESLYATWNYAVKNARYEKICFWNVDDIRFGKGIISGIKDIDNGADIVYFSFLYFRYLRIKTINILAKIKIKIPPPFDRKRFSKEMLCDPFTMTCKKAFNTIGLFDETFYVAGDYEWCVRAAISGLNFKKNKTIAGIFTSDGTTLSGSKSTKHAEENSRIHNMVKP
ncbi:MAG: glycosyltransferase family 2 protein [Candidatus Taylorbacteria bacterium]